MSAALIVAEPETETRGFLERQLADDGFDVLGASHPGEVFDLAERVRPDLVLVAELELCTRLRDGEPGRSWNRDVPVILLGREAADAVDRARALERGADDYVDRPFAYEELRARIRAVLRRAAPRPGEVLEAGEITDRPSDALRPGRRAAVDAPGEGVRAAREAGRAARRACTTKDELLREVWGFRAMGRTRTLDSHASRVRRRIAQLTDTPYVINVWGVGYRLMLPA